MFVDVKLQEWRSRLEACERSGQTVSAWCARHRIPLHQYYYWRRRLLDSAPGPHTGKPKNDWIKVAVTDGDSGNDGVSNRGTGGVTIRIGVATIEVCSGFDEELLCGVVAALKLSLGDV